VILDGKERFVARPHAPVLRIAQATGNVLHQISVNVVLDGRVMTVVQLCHAPMTAQTMALVLLRFAVVSLGGPETIVPYPLVLLNATTMANVSTVFAFAKRVGLVKIVDSLLAPMIAPFAAIVVLTAFADAFLVGQGWIVV
jgi:hypothetical protein